MELFRIRGIPVRIDLGWLLIFGLVAWSLASGYFPFMLPAQSAMASWALGIGAALLLFASVLVHELAHALVALRHGVGVGGITLHLFGGVSQLESEPETPRAELLIAIVGPLTSFAIAGAWYAIGRLLTGPPWADVLAGYVAVVNLVVGVFNLVPAFPLDGGRVLRAALWASSGSLDAATRWAARVSTVLAVLMVAVGIVRALRGEAMGGIWLALIGLFLLQAARSSYDLVRVRARLDALRVEQVMNTAPAVLDRVRDALGAPSTDDVVAPRDSAWQAFLKIARSGTGRVAVVDDRALVGVVTQRDLQDVVTSHGAEAGRPRRAA
jgi:Zn-dependent protease